MYYYTLLTLSCLISHFSVAKSNSGGITVTTTEETIKNIYNINYRVDHETKTMKIVKVNEIAADIRVFPPNGFTNFHEQLDIMYHYPGVASNVVLTGVPTSNGVVLQVLLDDGLLLRVVPERVYVNFHVHKQRLIYGQLYTFALDDFALAAKIYTGAPIFHGDKLVSVITCRYDEYNESLVVYPVTGARASGLVSGEINFDDKVVVSEWEEGADSKIYGRTQLLGSSPTNAQRFVMSSRNNRQMYRDWPRTAIVFHNRRDVSIGLVEGEFEISRVVFEGPLIVPQDK
ncbi:p26-a [Hemileuca sp. nucleopolyhedrovirus]|uniref:p26-a n=1 Tax=Hemileuca sp. nucleopolyhedrovirus TaxID=1367203 RepID=S5MQ91_9ABAC|nr:p26-a [Hemileuca sp. nucleopolyhedrovirus]AGR56774.1 p26-a [Hemileuca sp. nucleopolyhedrovirus]